MSRTEPMLAGRMNVFQRLMYQWSELYPYNATHIYRIAGTLDAERLREAIRQVYRHNGIGTVAVSDDALSFQYESEDHPDLTLFDGGEHPHQCLTAQVAVEINRPFPRPRYQPLRFSVVTESPTNFALMVTYDHWVTDSTGVRLIVQQVLAQYFGIRSASQGRPLDLYPDTYRKAFARRLSPLRLVTAATRLLWYAVGNRAARQVAYSSATQMAVNFELYATEPGTVARLREFAHQQDATVNDVIQAALARAMAPELPRRSTGRGSQDLAIGNIVNARTDADQDLTHSLGAFLSYYSVRCRPEESAGLAALTRHIAAITGPIKARRGYLDSTVNMQLVRRLWPHLSAATKPRFMKKALPLTGGVSNVYVRDCLLDRALDRWILGHSRAVSTGPILPLVITPTTIHDRLNVGVTYRQTGFSCAKIERIMQAFLEEIQQPGKSRGRRRVDRREQVPPLPASNVAGPGITGSGAVVWPSTLPNPHHRNSPVD